MSNVAEQILRYRTLVKQTNPVCPPVDLRQHVRSSDFFKELMRRWQETKKASDNLTETTGFKDFMI